MLRLMYIGTCTLSQFLHVCACMLPVVLIRESCKKYIHAPFLSSSVDMHVYSCRFFYRFSHPHFHYTFALLLRYVFALLPFFASLLLFSSRLLFFSSLYFYLFSSLSVCFACPLVWEGWAP